ncbi:MAG: type II secretion system F family protein [Candidatus Anammoxibacter sp.]
MPHYKYHAVDRHGVSITATLSARNISALESKLAESGSILIEVFPQEKKVAAESGFSIIKPTVKANELTDFFTTLQTLINAGVPLLEALRSIREDIENPFFSKTLDDIISSVQSGTAFCDSLVEHPRVFSEYILGMVAAGEHSGSLPETFKELVRYLEWQATLKAHIKQATIYPASIFIALTIFIGVLFTFVVPRFVKLLTDLNVALPVPTRIVMFISGFMVSTWWIMIILLVLGVVGFKYARRHSDKFAFAVDRFKLNVALFGEINRVITVSRFAQNFAVLFKSGIPIIENLKLCQKLVGNKVMEKALETAREDVSGGMQLNESLRKYELFSSKEMLMITVGETSGDLGKSLAHIASIYNEEIPKKVKGLFSIMEPLVTLTLIAVVGFVALSIVLPMVSMFGGAR